VGHQGISAVTDNNDDFPDEPEDKTLLRPRPGGRRPAPQAPAQPVPPPIAPAAAPPQQMIPPDGDPFAPAAAPPPPQPQMAAAAPPPVQSAPVPTLDSIRGAGSSPLATAAAPLLVLMSQLRGLPSHADVNGLHQQVIARVQKFEAEAMAANVAPQHVASARYAICTALDETVLSTPWGSESVWSTHSLLTTFHQEAWGGEKFFQILDRLKTDVMANIDMLEVMYLCLSLGFEGKFKIQERGHVQIASVRDELYRLIRQARGEIERSLSPNWHGVEDRRNPLARYVPLWVVATVLITVLLGLFISFRFTLSRSTQPIDEVLSGVGVQDIASLNAVAVPNAIRLAPLLAGPESQGLINITEKGGITIVTLQGDNLFASGSAAVSDQYTAVLRQIGEAIEQVPGSVNVIGHTDNVPIRSFKFQSNWELSRERALDVAEKIAEPVRAKTRIVPRGVADTLPVAANDTAQGRAMNRRVEIIHAAQAATQ
jgi:type VI secretion system protein ImpK